jgi:TonB family protein
MGGTASMLVESNEPQINFDDLQADSESKRRLQLLFALVLLLTALVLVVLRNRQFWLDALRLEEASNPTTSDTIKKSERSVNPASSRQRGAKQTAPPAVQPHTGVSPEPHESALSPLQVDVTYAGGQHQTLVARSSAVHIDLQHNSQQSVAIPASAASSGTGAQSADGGERVRFSPQTVEVVVRPVEPIYPLLAQQENVQGSVVLQARIDKDGNVQALQVVSGPAILTAAALEAVKQWRFKPHFGADHGVRAETRITVNFTISTQ